MQGFGMPLWFLDPGGNLVSAFSHDALNYEPYYGTRISSGGKSYTPEKWGQLEDEAFRQAYDKSLGAAFNANIGAPLGLNLGGGLYRSSNPSLAGKNVSGLTGAAAPSASTPTSNVSPQATTAITQAATNLANVTKPQVPQFIQPYQQTARGFGAYGERDIF